MGRLLEATCGAGAAVQCFFDVKLLKGHVQPIFFTCTMGVSLAIVAFLTFIAFEIDADAILHMVPMNHALCLFTLLSLLAPAACGAGQDLAAIGPIKKAASLVPNPAYI
jgi:hypothetical protein